MLYEFKGELKNFDYWSNNIEAHPRELQRAYRELVRGDHVVPCYLAEFQGEYGVALAADFSRDYAGELCIPYRELVETAREKAKEYAQKNPGYDVIFGEDAIEWCSSDGSMITTVLLFLNWGICRDVLDSVEADFKEFFFGGGEEKKGEAACYTILKEN